MKPIATVPRALRTVDVTTGEEAVAPPPALRRLRRTRRRHRGRGDGRPGARRRGAGEVRRRLRHRDPPQRSELPRHAEVRDGDPTRRRARRPDGRGQDHGRPACSPTALGHDRSRHRRRRRGRRRAARSPTSSSTPARRTSARSSAAAVAARWPSTTASSRSAAAPCSTRDTRDLLRRPPRGVPAASGSSEAVKRVGLGSVAPAAARQRARPDQGAARRAHADLRGRGHRDRRHRRAHAAGGRRRDPAPGAVRQ